MKLKNLQFAQGFRVVLGNSDAQAAEMVLAPGATEGGAENRHAGSDQWLYVVSGTGMAVLNGVHHDLAEGSLLLIERGEAHEIRNMGNDPLRTLSFYVPPTYGGDGEELPRGQG